MAMTVASVIGGGDGEGRIGFQIREEEEIFFKKRVKIKFQKRRKNDRKMKIHEQ